MESQAKPVNRVYARLKAVKGDSIDHAHKDWLDIDDWEWGIQHARSWVSKSKRNQSAAFGTPKTIRFHKPPDAASAVLLQKCVEGTYLDTGTIEVWGANTAMTKPLIKIDLKDVTIVSVTTGTGPTGDLRDTVELAYGVISWEFQTLGGSSATGGWDFEINRKP